MVYDCELDGRQHRGVEAYQFSKEGRVLRAEVFHGVVPTWPA